LEHYLSCGRPALAVVVPAKTKLKLGMSLGYAFEHNGKKVVPSGINVNDGARIEDTELDQAVYVVDKVEVAVNINTVEELRLAEKLFSQI
jgi:adenosylcobinamide-phosphate guanylyltransferase